MSQPSMDLECPTRLMVAGFDYSTLTPEVARQARDAAEAIRRNVLQTAQEIGRHLLTMKEVLPHGAFGDWCEKALNVTDRSARNYMSVAKWLEGKTETLSGLPATVIYELAAPSAPADVVREVVAAAEAGALPEPEVISQRIKAARAEGRAVKQEMAKKPGRSEDDARRRVSKKREARAREDEKRRQELARENAEREARRERQRAAVRHLVASHREVVAAVVEAAEGDVYSFLAALKAALADSGR